MSDDDEPNDDELLDAVAAAFTRRGELFPIDEEEVARAEAAGADEVPLPPHLARWDEDPAEAAPSTAAAPAPVDLAAERRRRLRAIATHGVALALGAAAAAALTMTPPGDKPTTPSATPAGSLASGTPAPTLIELSVPPCEACCAGDACDAAEGELASCPSGRSCIPCDAAGLAQSRFRLELGAVEAAEAGAKVLEEYPRGQPELCVRAGASEEICVSTLVAERPDESAGEAPVTFTGAELGSGLSLRLRWKGVPQRLETAAQWRQPVVLTPTSLCKGYLARLTTAEGDVFGRVSLLLRDAHYVELARAPDVAALRRIRRELLLTDLTASMVATEAGPYALVLGPLPLPTAEAIRWQAAEQGLKATVTDGGDHRGSRKPLP